MVTKKAKTSKVSKKPSTTKSKASKPKVSKPKTAPAAIVAPPEPAPAPVPMVQPKTEAEKIWDEIKDKPIEMFALPNQFVAQYCTPVSIEPTRLFLVPSATSVLPSLEAALGSRYVLEMAEKYIIVTRALPAFTKK